MYSMMVWFITLWNDYTTGSAKIHISRDEDCEDLFSVLFKKLHLETETVLAKSWFSTGTLCCNISQSGSTQDNDS